MSSNLTPKAFDVLMDTEYPAAQDSGGDGCNYFEVKLASHPDLVELRKHIRIKLSRSDYFSWRGGDEIESFVEGFIAAVILIEQG